MEDYLNFLENGDDPTILANGRRPQYLGKAKTTSISFKMECDLNFLSPPFLFGYSYSLANLRLT